MTNMSTNRFTHGTIVSNAWSEIEIHLKDRLNTLREQNDSTEKSESETAAIRGRIAEIKRLIAMGNPMPEVTMGDA